MQILCGVKQLRQGIVIHPIRQIVADGAESLLTRQLMAAQQLEELVNIGHFTPFPVNFFGVRRGVADSGVCRLQFQSRVFCAQMALDQRHPGHQIGFFGGVHLMQGVALMVEELNAVAYAALVGFAHGKYAGPLIEKQAQIQLARVKNQPRVAVQMLVKVAAHLFMHRIAVASNGLGDANLLKLGQQGTRIGLQAAGVFTHAGMGQFRFADTQQFRQIACVFAGIINFCLLVTGV
ncbi:hypothetical protein D3C79_568590 [compost metagenome]